MTVKYLNENERNLLVSSYVIPDIYDLIWIMIQYAIKRNSRNIYLRLEVKSGTFELSDDGEGLNLKELSQESLLLQSLKSICQFIVKTRQKLGLFSEQLETDGRIIKTEADRLYKNTFIIKDLYKSQSLREGVALESLKKFESVLRAVVIENIDVDWKYLCEDSKTHFMVKMMKTRLGRCMALLKGKYQFVFESVSQKIKTLVRIEGNNYKGPAIILHNGLPVLDEVIKSNDLEPKRNENVFYINYSEITTKKDTKSVTTIQKSVNTKKSMSYKPLISAKDNCFKGTRDCLDTFKAAEGLRIVSGVKRDFLKDLVVIGQFDRKAILAKRICDDFQEIWMFDQHACAERINLENIMNSLLDLTRDEMNMRACRSSVKFGDILDLNHQKTIIKNLERCEEPFHCAHGRPTCSCVGAGDVAMKKFPSFKSANYISKDEEDNLSEKKQIKSARNNDSESGKRPMSQNEYKEDLSFGKRLDFTIPATTAATNSVIKQDNDIVRIDSGAELLKRRQVEFNEKLRKNPKDVGLWLEFIEFQNEGDERNKGNRKRKIMDRKISILKRAIELNPNFLELVFMHLDMAEEVEDSSTLMRIWEKYLKVHKGDVEAYHKLSKKYLEFRQHRFLAFSFDSVKDAFVDVFKNHKEAPVVALLPLYNSLFKFLKRCGYNELVIALIQALIEANIEQFNYGQVDMEAYEDQWDFGLMEHIGDDTINSVDAIDYYSDFSVEGRFKNWLMVEICHESSLWHPKHYFDSEEQVVFEDIKDFVIIIKEQRQDILLFIKTILEYFEDCFEIDYYKGLMGFYTRIYGVLLTFYERDWEYICKYFELLHKQNPENAEIFAKAHLSAKRDSLETFLAYGRFQEIIGNCEMAKRVYESLRKRSSEFNQIIESFEKCEVKAKDVIYSISTEKSNVYELVRSNPGDKALYMRIIELIESNDPDLALEIFNLIDEQQLKLFTFLE